MELEELNKEIARLNAMIKELEVQMNEKDEKAEELAKENSDLKTLVAELQKTTAEYEREKMVSTRTQKVAEAGIEIEKDPDKLAKKQEFWVSMSEEMFDEYVSDILAAQKPKAEARASASIIRDLPKVSVDTSIDRTPSLEDLKARFGRTPVSAE